MWFVHFMLQDLSGNIFTIVEFDYV